MSLPPITVDSSSYKVTDGRHRIEAFKKLDLKFIDTELKEYASEAEMFADAIRLNASHGRALSVMDEVHCLAKAQEFKLEQSIVATLLNITTERAEELVSNRLATSGKENIVLKGSTAWMAGRKMTDGEVAYNRTAGGPRQSFYINQVIAMLENDAVNWEATQVSNGLKKLFGLLKEALAVKA